ncbi:MAG TPA: sugar transferase, partial [Bdellovibrionota bacterium]|nr:sugar transferase [Bdellovibrionota bacterium]
EIDQIIISRGAVRELNHGAYLIRAHLAGIPIVDRRALLAEMSGRIRLTDQDSWSFLSTATQQTPVFRLYAQAKVLLEPVLALVLGILLSPLMLIVAIAIRLDSHGPIFYRQLRTGYLGVPFHLIKFRSMRIDAEASGAAFSCKNDSRVTTLGRIIRGLRIDELPQLWNVMRGEMSFVGPRPERPEFYQSFKEEIPLFSMRTTIRPGVTGWAQVCAGYAASVEESKTKLEYDLYYIKHVSPRIDLVVMIKTIRVALMGSERAQAKPTIARAPLPVPAVTEKG